jgi:hypothetical protein
MGAGEERTMELRGGEEHEHPSVETECGNAVADALLRPRRRGLDPSTQFLERRPLVAGHAGEILVDSGGLARLGDTGRRRAPGPPFRRRTLPRERQRFSESVFVDGIQLNRRASAKSPRAVLGPERIRRIPHELSLLFGRERDHARFEAGVERREDPAIHAKVRVAHVGPFECALHPQRDPPEVVSRHACLRWSRVSAVAGASFELTRSRRCGARLT